MGEETGALAGDAVSLARMIGAAALPRGLMIACAESCTGGLVAGALTAIAGSSAWFERGFVTYSNESKIELLGVPAETLERYGAVSAQTARAMAEGALGASPAALAVAVTGVAGPGGGSADKPVGTVWFAWSGLSETVAIREWFPGDRAAIREASVMRALRGLLDRLT